jgi:hypothetical protein
LAGESDRIPAGAYGKIVVAGLQFGDTEVPVFVGYRSGPLFPYSSPVLQTPHEKLDWQTFDRFAIFLANSPVDDAFRNQFENHRGTVGTSNRHLLARRTRLKIVFGEVAWFSHGDRSLSSGETVELKFSVRSREHGTLSIEINLHERTADRFGGN